MPQFNIHWKGCPHHHLPRIRVASCPKGNHSPRSLSHLATQDIVRSTFGSHLEKARLEQRTNTRRERRRICRSSVKSCAGGQGSQKPKQDVRFSGSNICHSVVRPINKGRQIIQYLIWTLSARKVLFVHWLMMPRLQQVRLMILPRSRTFLNMLSLSTRWLLDRVTNQSILRPTTKRAIFFPKFHLRSWPRWTSTIFRECH